MLKIDYHSANCGPPAPPIDGYILPYLSLVEGATVTVVCQDQDLQTVFESDQRVYSGSGKSTRLEARIKHELISESCPYAKVAQAYQAHVHAHLCSA